MRNMRSRQVDSEKLLQHLQMKHDILKHRIYELDCRSFLTAAEDFERKTLKKQKLAAKDAIMAVRRDVTAES